MYVAGNRLHPFLWFVALYLHRASTLLLYVIRIFTFRLISALLAKYCEISGSNEEIPDKMVRWKPVIIFFAAMHLKSMIMVVV